MSIGFYDLDGEVRLGRHARQGLGKELKALYQPVIDEQLPNSLDVLLQQIPESTRPVLKTSA